MKEDKDWFANAFEQFEDAFKNMEKTMNTFSENVSKVINAAKKKVEKKTEAKPAEEKKNPDTTSEKPSKKECTEEEIYDKLEEADKQISHNYMNMCKEYIRDVMHILKSYNGILDKDVLVRMLEEKYKTASIWKKFDNASTEIENKSGIKIGEYVEKIEMLRATNPHQEALNACFVAEEYCVLQWRGLMMTKAGFKRIIRIGSDLIPATISNQYGVELEAPCTFPDQWFTHMTK